MAKDLEFFDEFFAAPEKMIAREFYTYVHEWLEYLKEHEGEFNYLEDEEWTDRKDRVLEVLTRQEDLKDEFEEIEERLDTVRELETSAERNAVYKDWLAFMKRNQVNYDISDETINEMEEKMKRMILSALDWEIAEERLKGSKARHRKSVEELDEALDEHYRRTGKRPILTSLKHIKGN